MKQIIIIFLFALILTVPATALGDPYSEEYSLSGAEALVSEIPSEARKILDELEADPSEADWVSSLSVTRILSHLGELLTGSAASPISAGGGLLGLIILSAAFPALSDGESSPAALITVLCTALCIAVPIWESISAAVSAVKACSEFMLAFVPVFMGIAALSGGGTGAASAGAVLLSAAEGVGAVSAFVILPVMGAYLAISICTAVFPFSSDSGIADSLRRAAMWLLSLITTVFLGVLGIQTAVNSAADTLALKTGKFIIGTAVPIAGQALSEAAAAVTASLALLRSSVGAYGIVALAAILLPIIAELLLWRAVITVCSAAARQFSLASVNKLLKAVDQMLAFLIGIILLIAAMLIISLSLTVGSFKTV